MPRSYNAAPQIRFSGTMWGRKPDSNQFEGATFTEFDTGRKYRLSKANITAWRLAEKRRADRGYHEHPDSSTKELYGREFAVSTPSSMYLLEESASRQDMLAEFGGGDTLLNLHNRVDTIQSHIGMLNGYDVASYPSAAINTVLYREAAHFVGADSFLLGGWFRIESLNTDNDLLFYGDAAGSHIRISMTANNEIRVSLQDAAGLVGNTFIPAINIRDLQWHYIGLLLDKQNNVARLITSNGIFELARTHEFIYSLGLGSFDVDNGRFVLGGTANNGVIAGNYHGEISNVQVYRWANEVDYNVLPLILSGIREPCAQLSQPEFLGSDSTKRFNNGWQLDGIAGNYVTALVNLDAGLYDIHFIQHYADDAGSYQIFIDNIDRGGYDLYSASNFNNFAGIIDDIELDKGPHFLKLQLNQRHASSTDDKIRLSQIKFSKKDGSNEGGASEFLIFGDELRERSNQIISAAAPQTPYNNAITHRPGASNLDGTFARGEQYLSEGSWKIGMVISQGPDCGILKLLVNGAEILEIDGYHPSVRHNQTKTVFARIPQGRNKIELKVSGKNPVSGGWHMHVSAIRGKLQSETSYADTGLITGADTDEEIITGDAAQHQSFTSSFEIFGVRHNINGLHSKATRKQWFTGGLYKVEYDRNVVVNGGRQKITLETDRPSSITVWDSVQFEIISGENQPSLISKLVEIPRGYHYVTFENIANGSTGNCQNQFSFLRFTNLGRVPLAGDADLTHDSGGYVPIAEHVARKPGANIILETGGITPDKWEDLRLKINGRSAGAMSMAVQLNDITSPVYKKLATVIINGVEQPHTTVSSGDLTLISSGLLTTGAQSFTSIMDMIYGVHEQSGKWISQGFFRSVTHESGDEHGSYLITGDNVPKLSKIQITAVGAGWNAFMDVILEGKMRKI